MSELDDWCQQWGVSPEAINDLRRRLVASTVPAQMNRSTAEQVAQADVRLEAAEMGMVLWRNNNGVAQDSAGNWIRFGLANDSKAMNAKTKSSDLIGIRPVTITPDMVGTTVGQFVAREVKRFGWSYRGTAREEAQAHFLELVLSMGGDAGFATGRGSL